MNHIPSNPNCDKNQYGDAPDVRCTCDVDSADDVPEPSTVVGGVTSSFANAVTMHGATGPDRIILAGRQASTHAELRAAGLEYKAAQELVGKAKTRWDAALQAHMQEMIG